MTISWIPGTDEAGVFEPVSERHGVLIRKDCEIQ